MNDDEKQKYRRDIILKVLTWGTAVYLIAWGYSLTQSSLFELQPSPQVVLDQENERKNLVNALRNEANANDSNSAKKRVEAAKIEVDNYLENEIRSDNYRRAFGLIAMTLIYCIGYIVLVWQVYERVYPDEAKTDIIPKKWAMIYAIFMSFSTLFTACSTAYN